MHSGAEGYFDSIALLRGVAINSLLLMREVRRLGGDFARPTEKHTKLVYSRQAKRSESNQRPHGVEKKGEYSRTAARKRSKGRGGVRERIGGRRAQAVFPCS